MDAYFTNGNHRHAAHVYTSRFGGLSLCGRQTARLDDRLTRKVPTGNVCKLCQQKLAESAQATGPR